MSVYIGRNLPATFRHFFFGRRHPDAQPGLHFTETPGWQVVRQRRGTGSLDLGELGQEELADQVRVGLRYAERGGDLALWISSKDFAAPDRAWIEVELRKRSLARR